MIWQVAWIMLRYGVLYIVVVLAIARFISARMSLNFDTDVNITRSDADRLPTKENQ